MNSDEKQLQVNNTGMNNHSITRTNAESDNETSCTSSTVPYGLSGDDDDEYDDIKLPDQEKLQDKVQ